MLKIDKNSALKIKMHTENKIALEMTTPERKNASIKANKSITNQAYSAFAFTYNSIRSNIRITSVIYCLYFTLFICLTHNLAITIDKVKYDRKI